MGQEIENGWGDGGFKTRVGKDGRLYTYASIIERMAAIAEENGETFAFPTDFIPLTSIGIFSGVAYIKNTSETKHLHIYSIRTCGDSINKWKIIKNPTTGTLISAGTDFVPGNLNFSSKKVFTGDFKRGVDGQTVTDGGHAGQHVNGVGHSTDIMKGAMILGQNDSIALLCKPAVNPTDVCAQIIAFYEEV